MNGQQEQLIISVILASLLLSACGAPVTEPTATPGFPLIISAKPDATLGLKDKQVQLFDLYCRRAEATKIDQIEIIMEIDATEKKTSEQKTWVLRLKQIAISECSGWMGAEKWANSSELAFMLGYALGLKGEGRARIALYKAYPEDQDPPSPRPESERFSPWVTVPAKFE